jgi:hypothetical protein
MKLRLVDMQLKEGHEFTCLLSALLPQWLFLAFPSQSTGAKLCK